MLVKYVDQDKKVKIVNVLGFRAAKVSSIEHDDKSVDVEFDFCRFKDDWMTLRFKDEKTATEALETILKYYPGRVKVVTVDYEGETFQVTIND